MKQKMNKLKNAHVRKKNLKKNLVKSNSKVNIATCPKSKRLNKKLKLLKEIEIDSSNTKKPVDVCSKKKNNSLNGLSQEPENGILKRGILINTADKKCTGLKKKVKLVLPNDTKKNKRKFNEFNTTKGSLILLKNPENGKKSSDVECFPDETNLPDENIQKLKKKLKRGKLTNKTDENNGLIKTKSNDSTDSKKKKLKKLKQNRRSLILLTKPLRDEEEENDEKLNKGEPKLEDSITEDKKKEIKKKMFIQRVEASQDVSEFNLANDDKEKVILNELVDTLKKTLSRKKVKSQLEKAKKLQTLQTPLEKPQLEKIQRTLAYTKVCDEVAKWEPIVRKNRVAQQIIYPLKEPEYKLPSFDEISKGFVTRSPLEEEIYKLLNNSENVLDKKRELTVAEEKALKAMSLEEAKLRRAELMRHRALLSQQAIKAHWKNKIKSKKYRRLLKKDKMKQMLKEYEELQKTDQEAAVEKLKEADKIRVLERMTQKHRNTGKWAKQQKLRAKYNLECRDNLKEDLNLGRKLKEKLPVNVALPSNTSQRELLTSNIDQDIVFPEDEEEDFTPREDTIGLPFAFSKEDGELVEQSDKAAEPSKTLDKMKANQPKRKPVVDADMDFSTEIKFLDSMIPDDILGDEDEDREGTMTIRQAFADEGLVAEFKEDKKMAEKANEPESIDLFLPGWGSWGGPNIKVLKKTRNKFLIQPPAVHRQNNLGHVIFNEDKDKKAAKHQVSQLRFPFTSVPEFENYIKKPVGNTWNPETSFQKIIAPRVVTKIGKIISPIDEDDVEFNKKQQNTEILENKSKKQSAF